MNRGCSIRVFTILSAVMPMQEPDNIKAFPPAEKGMTRHVLKLPKQVAEFVLPIQADSFAAGFAIGAATQW